MIDWYFDNTDHVMSFLGPVLLIHGAVCLLHKDYLSKWNEQNVNTVKSLWRRGMRGVSIGILLLIVVRADPSTDTYRNLTVGGFGFLFIAFGTWTLMRLPQLVGRSANNVNQKNAGTSAMVFLVSGLTITFIQWLAPIIFD